MTASPVTMHGPRLIASLGMLGALGALVGCTRLPSLERVAITDPSTYWTAGGFAEMVPAIRPPTSADGTDRITTWLRVPAGGAIGVRRTGDGRAVPIYPPGTVADRVELDEPAGAPEDQHAWNVVDVRGTRLEAGGAEQFHCLLPTGRGRELVGFGWPRDDMATERIAADGLVSLAAHGRSADDDDPRLARLRRLTHCAPCHDHDRAERTRIAEGGPRRATDDAGFYSVLGVLSDDAPLEDHRPRDLNADDRFVTLAHPGGGVPRAHLDLAAALAAGQAHAIAVCWSRRYLFDHMDASARRAFSQAFSDCGLH